MGFLNRLFGRDNSSSDKPKESKEQLPAVYTDSKWGFSIRHPLDWSVARGEHVEGTWTKPVVLVKNEGDNRTAILIVSIGAMHKGGTTSEYMDKAKADLSNSFEGFMLTTAEQRTVSRLPTAWMQYRYIERGKYNEEYNVTFMLGGDTGVPFQIICFTDCERFQRLQDEFDAMIQSLTFPNNRLQLAHISLYGSSVAKCQCCGSLEDASPVITFPDNVFKIMCKRCRC